MKKNKSISGGILLEVLFMLGIIIGIFPIIQKDMKRRTDAIRNQMIVRDLLKLKSALEKYLDQKPTKPVSDVPYNITMEELHASGLDSNFSDTNILGQKYNVKMKVSEVNGILSYDAIIIADDASTPTMRVRDIVKETKGYAGYVEQEGDELMAYSENWQMNLGKTNQNLWGVDNNSLVVKPGITNKEYKYVSRVANSGSASMETHLYMNNHDIVNVNSLFISDKLNIGKSFTFPGTNNIKNVVIQSQQSKDEAAGISNVVSLSVSKPLKLKGGVVFSAGLNANNLDFVNSDLVKLSLTKGLNVLNALEFTDSSACSYFALTANNEPAVNANWNSCIGSDICLKPFLESTSVCNRLRSIKGKIAKSTYIYISNLLRFNGKAIIGTLNVRSFDINNSVSSGPGLKFTNLAFKASDGSATKYKLTSSSSSAGMNDVIVTEVNRKLISLGAGGTNKIGGITITNKTPLSLVFRALWYYFADLSRLAQENFADNDESAVSGVVPLLSGNWKIKNGLRCELESCNSEAWHN